MSELDEYREWMEKNNHEPEVYDDYGGPTMNCSNRKCSAASYDWESYHIIAFRREQARE